MACAGHESVIYLCSQLSYFRDMGPETTIPMSICSMDVESPDVNVELPWFSSAARDPYTEDDNAK